MKGTVYPLTKSDTAEMKTGMAYLFQSKHPITSIQDCYFLITVTELFTPASSNHLGVFLYTFFTKEEEIADLWVFRPLIFLNKYHSLPLLACAFISHNGSKVLTEQEFGAKQSQRSSTVKHWNHIGQYAEDENNHSWPHQPWSSITPESLLKHWKTYMSAHDTSSNARVWRPLWRIMFFKGIVPQNESSVVIYSTSCHFISVWLS